VSQAAAVGFKSQDRNARVGALTFLNLVPAACHQNLPADFNTTVGAALPSSINTHPLPKKAARDVPAARSYRYAMTQDKVLLVNPSDDKIADVVTK